MKTQKTKIKYLYNYEVSNAKYRRKSRKVSGLRVYLRKYLKYYGHFLIGIVFIVLGFYIKNGLETSEKLKISNVEIIGANSFVNESDLRVLAENHAFGQYYFKIDLTHLENISKENFLGAKKIDVSKKFPNKIILSVTERVPLAVLKNPKSPEYYLVDEDGYVLGIIDEEKNNLPLIQYNNVLHVGFTIDKNIIPIYLELLTSIDKENLYVSTVSVTDKYLNFTLEDSIDVYIGEDKNITKSVLVISELLKSLKLDGKDVKKIDLRYDKVIVEYN
jgi:cell division septal protein FtsQ